MLTRRSFLKGLLSLPLVAAIPNLVQAIEQLPEEAATYVTPFSNNWWLRINGKPMCCMALSIDSTCETIDAWDSERQVPNVYRGLMRNRMEVELENLDGVPALFYQRDELLIEAKMGPATVVARGLITSVTQLAVDDATNYRNTLSIELFSMDYKV